MPAARPTTRIPLNTLAVPFGLAGFAEAWTLAAPLLHVPDAVPQSLWAVAAVAWVWLIGAHLLRGARVREPLADQLRHPAQGPIAALVPATAMLLASDLQRWWPLGARVLLVAALVVSTAFAGWLLATWFEGRLALDAVHGGYLLPTVASALVGASGAHAVGLDALAWGAFGVGLFFWGIMTALLLIRLAFRPALPAALVPTMAILVAPPSVAGLVLFGLTGDQVTVAAQAIAGLGVLLLAVQVALVPRYVRLPFTLGAWSFTFPAAAVVSVSVEWMRVLAVPGGWIVAAALLLALSVLVAVVGVRSIVLAVRHLLPAAEAELVAADDEDAEPGPITGSVAVATRS